MNAEQEQHKLECLARHVCAMKDRSARILFLAHWELRHGKRSTDRLKGAIKAEWRKKRDQRHRTQADTDAESVTREHEAQSA